MTAAVLSFYSARQFDVRELPLGDTSPRLQRALAFWFDIVSSNNGAPPLAAVLGSVDLMNEGTVVFEVDEDGAVIDMSFAGDSVTPTLRGLAREAVVGIRPMRPQAYRHVIPGGAFSTLALPFIESLNKVVVIVDA